MSITINDYIGQKYNRWKIESFAYIKNHHKFFNCVCECGNRRIIDIQSLKSGNSKSCGCLRNETTSTRSLKHGKSTSRLNRIYRGIKNRCYNSNTPGYKKYGAKGIKMCPEWLGEQGFEHFYEWAISHGYQDGLSIDRFPNQKGDYEPNNCRWATAKMQANNLSTNTILKYNGESHTIAEWSEILGIRRTTICERHRRGLPTEKVLAKTDLRGERWNYQNQTIFH